MLGNNGRGSSSSTTRRTDAKKEASAEILSLASSRGLPIVEVDKGVLNALCGSRPHQGYVLRCGKRGFDPVGRLPGAIPPPIAGAGGPSLWLALDEVVDPQNLGEFSFFFLGGGGVGGGGGLADRKRREGGGRRRNNRRAVFFTFLPTLRRHCTLLSRSRPIFLIVRSFVRSFDRSSLLSFFFDQAPCLGRRTSSAADRGASSTVAERSVSWFARRIHRPCPPPSGK